MTKLEFIKDIGYIYIKKKPDNFVSLAVKSLFWMPLNDHFHHPKPLEKKSHVHFQPGHLPKKKKQNDTLGILRTLSL